MKTWWRGSRPSCERCPLWVYQDPPQRTWPAVVPVSNDRARACAKTRGTTHRGQPHELFGHSLLGLRPPEAGLVSGPSRSLSKPSHQRAVAVARLDSPPARPMGSGGGRQGIEFDPIRQGGRHLPGGNEVAGRPIAAGEAGDRGDCGEDGLPGPSRLHSGNPEGPARGRVLASLAPGASRDRHTGRVFGRGEAVFRKGILPVCQPGCDGTHR